MSKSKKPPYWQTTPCPDWCNHFHNTNDGGPDRMHFSEWERRRKLTQHDAKVTYDSTPARTRTVDVPELLVSLHQGARECAPLIAVESEGGEGGIAGLHLTIAEAEWLTKSLQRALKLASELRSVRRRGDGMTRRTSRAV